MITPRTEGNMSNGSRSNNNNEPSLFYLRPEAARLKQVLDDFVDNECIPMETMYEEHVAQYNNNDRWTIQAVPPFIEQLKVRAQQLGLFNLFLPQHLRTKLLHRFKNSSTGTLIQQLLPTITLSYREYGIFCETMGKCTIAAEICNCNAPDTGNMEVLIEFGTMEQQHQFLLPLLQGKIRSTFLMTEPNVASSDPTNLETKLTKIRIDRPTKNSSTNNTAQEKQYEYILSGQKWWSTGAMDPRCKCAIIVTKMDYTHPSLIDQHHYDPITANDKQQQKIHNGHTMVIVPLPHPNIEMKRPLTVFGYDDAPHGHAEVIMRNVTIQSNQIILGEGDGFRISQARLGPGRIHHCMRSIGLASRCYELMIQRTLQRKTFGKYLWEHGGVQEMIADSYADLQAARLLTLSCASTMDEVGVKYARQQIAMIKVMVPKLTFNVVDRAIQIYGGAGVSNDTILAKAYVGLRTLRIADGPDAVHQRTVARLEIQRSKKGNKLEKNRNTTTNQMSRL